MKPNLDFLVATLSDAALNAEREKKLPHERVTIDITFAELQATMKAVAILAVLSEALK